MTTTVIAFDRKSARSYDADGRMRVKDCILSTAEVNPYNGSEIPQRDRLGLDTNDVYDLYRDPAELGHADAIASFQGVPLMVKHIVQTAGEPQKEYQAGSVHSVHFDGKHLRGDLLVSDGRAIDLIESGELADLSCGYRYVPVMQSGEAGGQHFHGRMTAIRGNHVALVDTGRATNAHVADSAFVDPRSSNPTMNGETNMAIPVREIPQERGARDAAPGEQPGAMPPAAPAAAEPAGGGMAEVGAALKALAEQQSQMMALMQQMCGQAQAAQPGAMDMDLEEGPAAQVMSPGMDNEHEEHNEGHSTGGHEALDEEGEEDEEEEESEAAREGRGGAMDAEEETHDPMEPNGETTQPRMHPVSEGRAAEQQGRVSLSGGNNSPSLGAMDAQIQKRINQAVLNERKRAKNVERAKKAVAHVLGGDLALDSAGEIYREALIQLGVPTTSIKRGAERAAWDAAMAAQAAVAGFNARGNAEMAMDSDSTKAVRTDLSAKLSKIKVRA